MLFTFFYFRTDRRRNTVVLLHVDSQFIITACGKDQLTFDVIQMKLLRVSDDLAYFV